MVHAVDELQRGREAYTANSWTERAHQAYLGAGDVARAARCAFWIGHNLLFRGDRAQATGWFGRAQRLLEREHQDCVERGYFLIPVWLEQMARGDDSALATMEQLGGSALSTVKAPRHSVASPGPRPSERRSLRGT